MTSPIDGIESDLVQSAPDFAQEGSRVHGCQYTNASAQRFDFDRRQQRHRAAAIVGAVHDRADSGSILRRTRAGSRTHIVHGAVGIDPRGDGLPSRDR